MPVDIVKLQGDVARLEGEIAKKLQKDIDNLAVVVIAIRQALQQPVREGKPVLRRRNRNSKGRMTPATAGLAGRKC